MPTKRRRLANTHIGISPAAIEAWRIGDFHGLHAALGVRPWHISPFDVVEGDDPENPSGMLFASPDPPSEWRRAVVARRRLIELAGAPGGVGRHGEPLGPGKPNYHPGDDD
jgi:hypothetical protein